MQNSITEVINAIRANNMLINEKKRLSGYLNICAHMLNEVGVDVEETTMKDISYENIC